MEIRIENVLSDENLALARESLQGKRDSCGLDGIKISMFDDYWKVNGEKIGAPFTIKAIGLPEVLINVDRVGGYLDYLKDSPRYLKVSVEKMTDKKTITIPKYTGVIKFQYAMSK